MVGRWSTLRFRSKRCRTLTDPVKPRSATPARLADFVEPMKAKLVDSMPSGGDWIYEIKFDGYRAWALRGGGETQILSRNQKDLGSKFPEVKASIAALDVQDAIVDGEILPPGLPEKSSSYCLRNCD
jgi:bifunctional non-homologous end joining protein LigD